MGNFTSALLGKIHAALTLCPQIDPANPQELGATRINPKLLTAAEDDPSMGLWSTVFFATFGLSAISTLMLTIKRVHDLGLPGVMALSIFVPGVSLVVLVLLCVWPTTDNADRYGARRDWPAG